MRRARHQRPEHDGGAMTLLVWNGLLALIWAIALGRLTATNLFVGFIVGYFVLMLAWRLLPAGTSFSASRAYFGKGGEIISFVGFFIWALTVANIRMAWYAIGPPGIIHPGIIAVPLREMTEIEVTTLGNLVTLTPGTLTIDVSPDRRTIYVHVMDARDPDRIRREIQDGFERRVLELLR